MRKIEAVLVSLFALLSLSTLVLAIDCPIPDTGQTKCYDNDSEITCPNPGEDFYGQDADYTPCNPHSYTKLDGNGNSLPDTASSWVMVRDNVTDLIWLKDTAQGYYDWLQAIDYCESLTPGGYSDWRLPTIKELSTIIDISIPYPGPAINADYFPDTQSYYYWSSTTDASRSSHAWVVNFHFGEVYCTEKSYVEHVRAVRGGQCGSLGDFVDNDDGTVTDNETGLMWQKDTVPETYTWEDALSYCENLILNNDGEWTNGSSDASGVKYSDWRLPNRNELQTLADYDRYNPSINTTYFPNTQLYYYWSSTTYDHLPFTAWIVDFHSGDVGYGDKSYTDYVRAVRGGQCGSLTTTTITGSTTTTTTILPQPCISKSLYGEHSDQTELLRYLRDNVLIQTPEGQEIIKLYYALSPVIVEMMNEDEEFKNQVKEMIDEVVEVICRRHIYGILI